MSTKRARRRAVLVAASALVITGVVLAIVLPSGKAPRPAPAPAPKPPPPPATTTPPPAPPVRASQLGAHSMLYVTTPYPFKQVMFAEAAALGASEIRVDVDLSGIFPTPGATDWTGLDDYIQLARQYGLRVLADITATPLWLANCPAGVPPSGGYRCGTDRAALYGALVGKVVAHAAGAIRDWEIVNEPDATWAFVGTPEQYARMLSASYDAIHRTEPDARVLIGGIMDPGSRNWVSRVFAVPGADAVHKFDIANVHLRGALGPLVQHLRDWISYFRSKGFNGPLWVTEHGYSADPAYQKDPAYRYGPEAQAKYLSASIPALLDGGAAKVFVTERDNGGGKDASEGLLGGNVMDPPSADPQPVRKPAFFAVQALARRLAAGGHP